MKKQILLFAAVIFTLYIQAQTYPVGTQTITYTDVSRSNRSVGVEFHYPGTNSTVNTGQFPFVVFAHGFSMDQTPYIPYADSLAKRGYIVGLLTTETGLSPSHPNFAQDLLFVYSKLISEGNSNNASPFYQHVVAKGAIGGHSMGGGSTVLAAQYGNPQVCSFTFSAATTNPSSISTAHLMTKPYLSFAGSSDCIAPIATNQKPMYDSSGAPCKFLINIANGLHCQYGTANTACSFGEGVSGCASSSLTRTQQINKTLYYLIPYLDYYLKGDCSAWTLFESRYSSNTTDALQRNCTNSIPSNPSISGSLSFCQGSNTTLTANPTGFQYVWSNNSTLGTLSVSASGNYSVVVGNGTCSLAAVSASVTQNLPPVTPSAITANDTVCSSIANLNISVQNDPAAATYNWTLPSGWSITSGINTNAIQATSGSTGGTISVTAQNNCGNTAPVTKTVTVVPSNLGTPGSITGATNICAGTTQSYSIANVSGATSYTWTYPSGWAVTSGANTETITFTSGATEGDVLVQAVNSCGNSAPATTNVVVKVVPDISTPISGVDSICRNNSAAITFVVAQPSSADSLIWSATNGWNIVFGQGTNAVDITPTQSASTISVYATNNCGTGNSQSLNVTVLDTPQVTITAQGNQLLASAAASYQWYLNGTLLTSEISSTITPITSGNYSVQVTDANGCSGTSSSFNFVINAIQELSASDMRIFPNPNATGLLQIDLAREIPAGLLKIFDATGRLAMQTEIRNQKSRVSIANLSAGLYTVSIEATGVVLRKKLVIE